MRARSALTVAVYIFSDLSFTRFTSPSILGYSRPAGLGT